MYKSLIYDWSWRKTSALAWLLCATAASAAPVRVTTWNIEPGTNATAKKQSNLVQKAAEVFKKSQPDVIILQGVPDWQSCNDLLKALKPAKYNIAARSSFRDAVTGKLSKQQVAILAKGKAYISWSDAWKSNGTTAVPGGFAFAAIRLEDKNAGFFSVKLDEEAQQPAREESIRQLLHQIESLKNWTTNRIQVLVVAGDFGEDSNNAMAIRLLEQSGLVNGFGNLSPEKRVTLAANGQRPDMTADFIFARDIGRITAPEITRVSFTEHYPVTSDLDLDALILPTPMPQPVALIAPIEAAVPERQSTPVPASVYAAVPIIHTNETATLVPATPVASLPINPAYRPVASWKTGVIAAGAILLMAVIWKLARRHRVVPSAGVSVRMKAGESVSRLSGMQGQIMIASHTPNTAGSAADHPPVVHIEAPSAVQAQIWQQRAEEAERRAAQATSVVRQGLMSHLAEWLKGKFVQRLVSDRAQLMQTQQAAALKMKTVDDRLAKIERQLQERNQTYERRIEELELELIEAREENRELIRGKIAQVKAEMEKERADSTRREGRKQS